MKSVYPLVGEVEMGTDLMSALAGGLWHFHKSHSSFPSQLVLLTESYYHKDEKGPEVPFFQLPILQRIPSIACVDDMIP